MKIERNWKEVPPPPINEAAYQKAWAAWMAGPRDEDFWYEDESGSYGVGAEMVAQLLAEGKINE